MSVGWLELTSDFLNFKLLGLMDTQDSGSIQVKLKTRISIRSYTKKFTLRLTVKQTTDLLLSVLTMTGNQEKSRVQDKVGFNNNSSIFSCL